MPTLIDRIRELLGEEADTEVAGIQVFSYTWSSEIDRKSGYEQFLVGLKEGSTIEISGVYHPNVVCEGIVICEHCGRTMDY